MRDSVLSVVSEKIIEDNSLIAILGDLGVFQMRHAKKKKPAQVINYGIMEQSMIGFAAVLLIEALSRDAFLHWAGLLQ